MPFRAATTRSSALGMTLILLFAAACGKPAQQLKKVVRAARVRVPQIAATVVTQRTTLQPSNRTTVSTIVIGPDAARATDETGQWRLFDLKENRVAFVNDFAKTFRYESLQSLRDRYDDAADEPVSDKIPRAEFASTPERRVILGVAATRSIVKLGGYQREIWFGSHPLIPPQLFELMQASRAPSPDAAMTKRVDDALFDVRGFPLAEHSELPYANAKIIVDREVVSIDRKNVQATLLEIPADYREVKPARPVARPKPVAPPAAPAPEPPVMTITNPPATTSSVAAPAETTTQAEPKKPVEGKKPAATVMKASEKKAPEKKAPAKRKAPAKKKTTTTKKTSQSTWRTSPSRFVTPSRSKNSSNGIAILRESPKNSLNCPTSIVCPFFCDIASRAVAIVVRCT